MPWKLLRGRINRAWLLDEEMRDMVGLGMTVQLSGLID